jgi:hypothetical protein
MSTLSTTTAALVPTLPDILNRRRKHEVTDLRPGDQLHLTAAILGFPKGTILPLYGYCVHTEDNGQPYAVRAYVRPTSLSSFTVPFSDRDARRYPAPTQREQWFGATLLYLTEIDLTDYADCLRLERLSQRVLPLLPATTEVSYCQAA